MRKLPHTERFSRHAVTDDPAPKPDDSASSQPHRQPGELAPLIYTSTDLLQGRREAWIEHEGEMYRLRLTSQGKLYLTK
jgi:hemin uptake protein HemP